MPFVWVQGLTAPEQPSPISYGPNAVSTQVGLVANSVNVQPPPICTISYNTPNVGYDIVCFYDSLNVDQFSIKTLIGNNITTNNASLNSATINTSTINTATISNLNVIHLTMNTTPTSNSHFATKGYVDALIANSKPKGGNLQLLILQAGDLLAGVADNTANRVAIGSNATNILTVDPSVNTKVSWKDSIYPQVSSFRGLRIGTHPEFPKCNSMIKLFNATEIVMDDGTVTNNWSEMTADINTIGAGGLDEGAPLPNTWYEVYAINNPTTDAKSLLIHRALDSRPHVSSNTFQPGGYNINQFLNTSFYLSGSGNVTPKIGQQFTAPLTGKVRSADILVRVHGVPNGVCWLTLHDQEANGFPNVTVLSTSDLKIAKDLASNNNSYGVRTRFIFRDGVSVSENSNYVLLMNTNYPEGGSGIRDHYIMLPGSTANTDAPSINANCVVYNANTNSWMFGRQTIPQGPLCLYIRVFIEANLTPIVIPTGYTKKALISYVATDIFTSLKEYSQRDRKISMPYTIHWGWYNTTPSSSNYSPFGFISPGVVQASHSLDAVYGIPPIPCIVTFTSKDSVGGQAIHMVGTSISSHVSTGFNFKFVELDGMVRANGGGGLTYIDTVGPVFVEEQVVNVYVASSAFICHISNIEI